MEVFLSNTCESFTGELDSKCGYYIRKFKGRWIAQRKSKGYVPSYGHWAFIVTCAELVQKHLYFSDIRVSVREVYEALQETGYSPEHRGSEFGACYNARHILGLAQTYKVRTEEEKIPLTTICARLERAILADVGERGLKILLYGWRCLTKRIEFYTLQNRATRDGFQWLSPSELQSFSQYAGYDLMID